MLRPGASELNALVGDIHMRSILSRSVRRWPQTTDRTEVGNPTPSRDLRHEAQAFDTGARRRETLRHGLRFLLSALVGFSGGILVTLVPIFSDKMIGIARTAN